MIMSLLFGLLGIGLGLLFPVLVIVLFVKMSSLKKRIDRLEARPSHTAAQVAGSPSAQVRATTQTVAVPQSQAQTSVPAQASQPSPSPGQQAAANKQAASAVYVSTTKDDKPLAIEELVMWLKEDWLLKTGALLLLIGFGWLVTYAFMNNWIGDRGRIALGIIVGAVILILGSWRIRTYRNQGVVFTALGSTVILLTVWAAREMYEFFNPFVALSIMFLSTVFVAFVSVKYRAMSLAIIGLILAAIAPNLTAGTGADYVSLFSYLSIVIVGIIWVVLLTGWRILTLLSLAVAFVYSIFVLDASLEVRSTILLFAYGLASLFYVVNTIGLLKIRNRSTRADIFTAAGNGMFLMMWILSAAQKEWQSLLISAWMLVFGAGAFIIFRYTRQKFAFYIYAGVGIAMLAAATAAELNGAALTIAYIIESAIISLIAYSALNDYSMGQKFSLLMLGPLFMVSEDISRFDRASTRLVAHPVWNKYFFSILILAVSLLLLGLAYRYFTKNIKKVGFFAKLYIGQIILGSLYLYTLLWHSLHNGLDNRSVAVMIAMIIYTVIGLFTHIYGKAIESKVFYFYGGIMLALVVLRLLFVDVWQMDMSRRIITFFLVGVLLISTAFINKKNNNLQT